MGYIWKALEKGYLENPRSACCTDDMFEIFVRFGVLLAASCFQQAAAMSSYTFTPRAVASPDAPQKPLTHKRARSGGAEWVQVIRHEPGSRAKKPRTSRSQPPACSHKEHAILTTAEATAFAAQFWDRRLGASEGTEVAGLAKIEEICPCPQTGGCLP